MKKIISVSILSVILLTSCSQNKSVQDIENTEQINNTQSNAETKEEKEIWSFIQEDVAKELKNPSSAEFGDYSDAKYYMINDDTMEVIGTIKGENNFGNTVENDFCATVILNSDKSPKIVSNIEFLGNEALQEKIEVNEEIEKRKKDGIEYLTEEELQEVIKSQPLFVTETKFIDSSELSYSSSSMLQAMIYNNSEVPVKNAVIGFCAWDKNGLPIKIKDYISISDGEYFKKIRYGEINLMPAETYTGKSNDTYYGMSVDKELDISMSKAIVVSYEDFDGNEWKNPNLLDFKKLYEEKRIVN